MYYFRIVYQRYLILCDICQNIVWTYITEEIYRKHNNIIYLCTLNEKAQHFSTQHECRTINKSAVPPLKIREKRWNSKEIKKFYWKWICKQKVKKGGLFPCHERLCIRTQNKVKFFCNISSYVILAYITNNYIALKYYAKIVHLLCQFHAGKVGFSAVCQAIRFKKIKIFEVWNLINNNKQVLKKSNLNNRQLWYIDRLDPLSTYNSEHNNNNNVVFALLMPYSGQGWRHNALSFGS
jgi:hypothetical protein